MPAAGREFSEAALILKGRSSGHPVPPVDFRQDLSKRRLEFLDRKLLPSSNIAFPFEEATNAAKRCFRSVIGAPVPPPLP
jgi:hypothetical protein